MNEHNFSLVLGRCFIAPAYVPGPRVLLDKTEVIMVEIEQRQIVAGHISPAFDEHGNACWYTTSAFDPEFETLDFSKRASIHMIKLIALTARPEA